MAQKMISEKEITAFGRYLRAEERSAGTMEKYLRDVRQFAAWLAERAVTKENVVGWKEHLLAERYDPSTVNGKLAALNVFFCFMDWQDCCVKSLQLQRRLFRDPARELTQEEYRHLTETARNLGKERLLLLMETICATGIRVSEVRYITVEAVCAGKAEIFLKGKIRTILIPNKLCRKLRKYAHKQKIASGEIFLTRSGKHPYPENRFGRR